jgi:FOG: Ankyrin repeat
VGVTFGDLEMVKNLISEGVNLSATSGRGMGLRLIATPSSESREHVGDLEMLKSLIPEEILKSPIAEAVDSNATGPSGETALMVASRMGFAGIVEVLLDAGAQIGKQDARGAPALCFPAQSGHDAIARLLLARGANPSFNTFHGVTFLHAAVQDGSAEIINIALQYPYEINARVKDGTTALLLAAIGPSPGPCGKTYRARR